MSVTYTVTCAECRARAPAFGDFGYVGSPSLDTGKRRGDLQTFGFIYASLASLQLVTLDLEEFRAFLERHRGHRVKLRAEGEELENGDDADDDVRPPRRRTAASRKTRVSAREFVHRLYELVCSECDVVYTASESARLRRFAPFVVTDERRRRLRACVGVLESSIERVSGFPFDDVDEIDRFLHSHRSHRVTARLAPLARPRLPARPTAATVLRPAPQGPASSYGMVGQNASRSPLLAELNVPLREAWTAKTTKVWAGEFRHLPDLMGLGQHVFLTDDQNHTVAREAATGRLLWTYPVAGRAEILHEGRLFVRVDAGTLHVMDTATGEREKTLSCPPGTHFVAAGRHVMGYGRNREKNAVVLWSIDWTTGRLWTETLPDQESNGVRTELIKGPLLAAGDTLVHDQSDYEREPQNSIVARRSDTGEVRWRVPFGWGLVGIAHDELVLAVGVAVDRGRQRFEIAAFRLRDGSPVWRKQAKTFADGDGVLSGGKYHYLFRCDYHTIDARSGKRCACGAIDRYPAGVDQQPTRVLAASKSHILVRGKWPANRLFAFTAQGRMECVWRYTTKDPNGVGYLVCFDGRLYFEDEGRIRCLAPD